MKSLLCSFTASTFLLFAIFASFSPHAHGQTSADISVWHGPMDIVYVPGGQRLYVAGERSGYIVELEFPTLAVSKTYNLNAAVTGMSFAPCSLELFVTTDSETDMLVCLRAASGEVRFSVPAGRGACSPVVSVGNNRLFVCNRYANCVSIHDLSTGKELGNIPVLREPIAAAVNPEETRLLVANHLPTGPSDVDNVAAAVTLVRLDQQNSVKHIRLPIGSTALRGLAMHPGGNICAATHNLARYQVPAVQVEQAWMNGSAVSLVDVKQERLIGTVLLDDPRKGAANPWAIAWTTDGKHLLVTHAGTHELSVIDSDALFRRLSERSTGGLVADLNFLNSIRKRIRLEDNGPRALCVISNTAVVAGFFSDSMSLLNLNPIGSITARRNLTDLPSPGSGARLGEQLFNDATLCHQQWQSCASCHPDGRADGLNWDLQNDGLGNPKNTKSLVWSHRTPPAMSSGKRETAEVAVRAGLRHILFAVRPEHEAAAMDEFLRSLSPVQLQLPQSNNVQSGTERGRRVFEDPAVGCVSCHPGPLFTDLKAHDVGTSASPSGNSRLDTPTLVEVWRTGPYLHDGSAGTLEEVLSLRNSSQLHGRTSHLSAREFQDLCAYLRTL